MDYEVPVVIEHEPDHLEQVGGGVGPDGQHLGRIRVGFEVEHLDRVGDRMEDVSIADTAPVRCSVDFHTPLL